MRQFYFAPPADMHALEPGAKGTFRTVDILGAESQAPVRRQMRSCNESNDGTALKGNFVSTGTAGAYPAGASRRFINWSPKGTFSLKGTFSSYDPRWACGDKGTFRRIHHSGLTVDDEDLHRRYRAAVDHGYSCERSPLVQVRGCTREWLVAVHAPGHHCP
jgi:hypothetical protein